MPISYSGIVNYGKVTLPSVEGWTNQNIAKDPPKSIHTRRIDKVGDTSLITQMTEDSQNRACEAISVYARSVNPSVSVSYNNNSNNAGTNGSLTVGGQTQAKLPYRIMNGGAFRPPVLRQENLLPLSRQKRPITSAFTSKSVIDFSKKMTCPPNIGDKIIGVHKNIMVNNATTAKKFTIETPISEPYEVKFVIQDVIHVGATSGKRTIDKTMQEVKKPTKEISNNVLNIKATTNLTDSSTFKNDISEVDTDRYIQNAHHTNVVSNSSSRITNTSSIQELLDFSEPTNKQIHHTNYTAPKSGVERNNYVHGDLILDKTLPSHKATTNVGQNIYKRIDHENEIQLERNRPSTAFSINPVKKSNIDVSSRQYNLPPKLKPGGFEGDKQIPSYTNNRNIPNIPNNKSNLLSLTSKLATRDY